MIVFWQVAEHIFAGLGLFFTCTIFFLVGDYIGEQREKKKHLAPVAAFDPTTGVTPGYPDGLFEDQKETPADANA